MDYPSFNGVGSKTPMSRKQHAENGTVNVRSKRCLHESCNRQPTFNVESSMTAEYCKQHAEDGMVCTRHRRSIHALLANDPAKIIGTNVAAIARTRHENDVLVPGPGEKPDSLSAVRKCGKRSRWTPTGEKPLHTLGIFSPVKADSWTVEMGPSKSLPLNSYPGLSSKHLEDKDEVETAAKQTRQVVPRTVAPRLPDEHQPEG